MARARSKPAAKWALLRRESKAAPQTVDPAMSAWLAQGTDLDQGTPWRDVKAEKRSAWWWTFRGLIVIVVIAVVAVPAIQAMRAQNAAPVVVKTAVPFPDAEARALSERFVESFYTWDAATPEQRKADLAVDVPMDANMSSGAGWGGKGKQTAIVARATTVDMAGNSSAHVSVVFRLVVFDSGGTALPAVWAQAVVPVALAEDDNKIVIAGMPGLVPLDEPVASTAEDRDLDSDVTAATKDYATSFFGALGAGEDVDASAAPGARIRGLAGAVELVRLDEWKVWAGSGNTREASASITWRNATTEFTSEYDLTLTETTGGGSSKWLVAAIHGITNP